MKNNFIKVIFSMFIILQTRETKGDRYDTMSNSYSSPMTGGVNFKSYPPFESPKMFGTVRVIEYKSTNGGPFQIEKVETTNYNEEDFKENPNMKNMGPFNERNFLDFNKRNNNLDPFKSHYETFDMIENQVKNDEKWKNYNVNYNSNAHTSNDINSMIERMRTDSLNQFKTYQNEQNKRLNELTKSQSYNSFNKYPNVRPIIETMKVPSRSPSSSRPYSLSEVGIPLVESDTYDSEDRTSRSTSKQTTRFVNAALNSHNKYRKKHGSPNLKYSAEIVKVAQNWADKLMKEGGNLRHRPNNKYGENLWMGTGYRYNDEQAIEAAVKAWYDEISLYKPYFNKEPNMGSFKNWGHFTQVVWKNSKQLGMGVARKNNKIVVVANYSPPGNVIGQFKENVRKA